MVSARYIHNLGRWYLLTNAVAIRRRNNLIQLTCHNQRRYTFFGENGMNIVMGEILNILDFFTPFTPKIHYHVYLGLPTDMSTKPPR